MENKISTKKAIGGSLMAIAILIITQILAELIASASVLLGIPEGICNIIVGFLYVGLAYCILKICGNIFYGNSRRICRRNGISRYYSQFVKAQMEYEGCRNFAFCSIWDSAYFRYGFFRGKLLVGYYCRNYSRNHVFFDCNRKWFCLE